MATVVTRLASVEKGHAPFVAWRQLKCVVHEARPAVLAVFFMRLVAATGLLWHPTVRALIVIAGWLPIVIAIYVYNGVSDVSSDTTNGSTRPIASGQLSCAAAVRWCQSSAVVGVCICWLAGPAVFILGVVLLMVGWAYSAGPCIKNKPVGFGVVVGLGAALTYIAGWFASPDGETRKLPIMLVVAAWVGLCCASKDFSDVEGDRLAGRHTWPVIFGLRGAARLLGAVATSGGVAALVWSVEAGVGEAPAVVLLGGSLLLAVVGLVSAAKPDRATRRRPYRAFMATQYGANLTMICTGLVR